MAAEWESDHEGFCSGRSVEGSRQKQIWLGCGDALGEEGDDGGVGDVHCCEGCEEVGGVFLDSCEVPYGGVLGEA